MMNLFAIFDFKNWKRNEVKQYFLNAWNSAAAILGLLALIGFAGATFGVGIAFSTVAIKALGWTAFSMFGLSFLLAAFWGGEFVATHTHSAKTEKLEKMFATGKINKDTYELMVLMIEEY